MKSRLIPVVLTAALTSLGTLFLAAHVQHQLPTVAYNPTQQAPVNYSRFTDDNPSAMRTPPIDFQNAAEASVKAVVHIKTTTKARTVAAQQDDAWSQIFGQRQYYMPQQQASGSGVVFSPDGYIVTNNHVVAGADEVTVTFNDRYTTQAKVVATDPSTDIAVLKVNETKLPYMEFGNSDDVHLGQWVLAVGYPLTLDATVTAGIVSAKSRSIGINSTQSRSAIESFIQTDAAVNPGNSGGALVNTSGQLIGINSAIASPTGSYAGYSYAIPANIVRKVVNDLTHYGTVQRAYIGIITLDRKKATPEQLTALGLDRTEGVYVDGLSPNSGAGKAGIQKGDFITQINGVNIATFPQLQEQIANYKPGDNVSVTYLRNGKVMHGTAELRNISGTTSMLKEGSGATQVMGATVKLRPLTATEQATYNAENGIVITDVGTGDLKSSTGIRKNFVIISVNDQTVNSVDDLQTLLATGSKVQIAGFYPGLRGKYFYGLNGESGVQQE